MTSLFHIDNKYAQSININCPSIIIIFFKGYDEIPALGRELGLTCSQLDEVDRYRTSGLSEMFWQICREYSIGQSETCNVTQMVGALAKIGINIEGI